MADKKSIDVGMFEIERAIMSNADKSKEVDISMLIASMAIFESITSAYVSADITLYDNHALPDEFPIVGEEILTIDYSDYYEKSMTLSLHVIAIDEIAVDDKSDAQSYVMRCVSEEFFASDTHRIQQSFTGTISQMVQTVYGEYFKTKELDIEETDGDRKFVIPSFTPVETINFWARKAHSASNKSSNFIFFENREKYYFKTHEQIFKDAKELPERNTFYYGETKMDVSERSQLMNHALTLKPKKRFNTMDTVRRGTMLTEVFMIDPATRSFTSTVYDHGDEFSSFQHSDEKSKEYHSSEFRNKYLNKESNVVNTFLTFEESNEGEKSFSEIIPRRNSTSFYLKSNVLEIEIYGCNDIFAGSILNIVIPEMKYTNGEKKQHPNLSGRYMVEAAIHTLQEKKWRMRLILIKDSFVDG